MFSVWFDSDFDWDLILHDAILFMDLKFNELVPYLQRLSADCLEESVKTIKVQFDGSQLAQVSGVFIQVLFYDFVYHFL